MSLHRLLALKRPLFVYDVETTGTDVDKDRIVEIGFQQWGPEGMGREYRTLVNPGVPMPEGAERVHGISAAKLAACRRCGDSIGTHSLNQQQHDFQPWPTFADLAQSLAKGFSDCDFAGKRVRFDLQVTAAEMRREGIAWSYAAARVVDVDRLEQIGDPRTLSHLYRKHLKKEPEGAHEALADVRMTTEILEAQLQAYESALPRDLGSLHDAQWPGWIDPDGKFKFIDGVPCVAFGNAHRNRPMKDVPGGYWKWMLGADFPPDVKRIVEGAARGVFPKEAE